MKWSGQNSALTKHNVQYSSGHQQEQTDSPFVYARHCKSSLNSSITSRSSRCENLKRWNNPRSSYIRPVDLFPHEIYDLSYSDCARVPKRSFGGHHEFRTKQFEQSSLRVVVGGWEGGGGARRV